MEHCLHNMLLSRRVTVDLVGVGGNGAQMATCLARLDIAMRALGHPFGLTVSAYDGDCVSEANIGRQLYSRADIGRNKAIVTINRLNQFYGFDWNAYPARYEVARRGKAALPSPDLVISCVDSRSARQAIHERLFEQANAVWYWLDLGNTETTAQVVLGEPMRSWGNRQHGPELRLPCVTELFPELLDTTIREDNQPTCSVRMSLASQGLFVNDVAVRFAAQLLYELFSTGRIRQHGVIVNLATKRTGPIDVDPATWRRFGYGVEDEKEDVALMPQAA